MITIAEPLRREIERHGEQTYPEECCGILLGTEENGEMVITALERIDNSQDANRRRRFLITAPQYARAEARARTAGLTLLGFYHSHPDHPARPSDFDTEHALPWFVYIIVSIASGHAAAMTAWQLEEERQHFIEQTLSQETVLLKT
jgi:proteasome lid subunit RPN8/RPN11